jgi:ribosomal protein S8
MFTTNPVANTVSTLRNAYQAKKLFVELPYCRAVSQLVCRLRDIGYIQHYVIRSTSHSPQAVRSRAAVGINPHRQVRLYLKYVECAPVFGDLRCY